MRYHFVLNGYLQNCQKLMQEMKAFKEMYLSDAEEGITYLYCQSEEIAKQLNGQLTKNVSVLAAEEYVPETVLKGLEELAKPKDIYIFGSDYAGEELAVRLGARMGGSSLTAVSSVGIENGTEDKIKAGKMVYSNHMEAVFQMKKGPYCISLAKGFSKMELHPGQMQIAEVHNFNDKDATSYIIERSFVPEDQEEGLEEAKVLIAAGRGIGKKEHIALLQELAERTGGQVGVSRPAAMNAWLPMNHLIGVSGAMTNPEVCITVGASGAAAFYAGIEKSKFIVAVNTDEKAPIMKNADVVVVEDFKPFIEALNKILEKHKIGEV